MADVAANDQRLVEEYVFSFFLCGPMSLPILPNFIPIEPGAFI
jgi:hypothetical protein